MNQENIIQFFHPGILLLITLVIAIILIHSMATNSNFGIPQGKTHAKFSRHDPAECICGHRTIDHRMTYCAGAYNCECIVEDSPMWFPAGKI
jgi:hypothetical protein